MMDLAYDIGWHLLRSAVFVAIIVERLLDAVFFVGYPAWRWSQFAVLCTAYFLVSLTIEVHSQNQKNKALAPPNEEGSAA